VWLLITLGIVAGAITTLAGLGGGLLLVVSLSLVTDPATALAVSAPALLLGNAHRAVLFRRAVDRRVALTFAAGAVPGALAAGSLVALAPPSWIAAVMAAATLVAMARAARVLTFRVRVGALLPAGVGVGALSATSGGGVLAAPVLRAAGLTGDAFVATGAVVAATMHVARICAYGMSGVITERTLTWSALLAFAIAVGNGLGRALGRRLRAASRTRIELAALCVCVALALANLGD
jgi:uncharacterized membrane protein YfcA